MDTLHTVLRSIRGETKSRRVTRAREGRARPAARAKSNGEARGRKK